MFRMHSAGDPWELAVGAKNETRTEQWQIHCFEIVNGPHSEKCPNCTYALCSGLWLNISYFMNRFTHNLVLNMHLQADQKC